MRMYDIYARSLRPKILTNCSDYYRFWSKVCSSSCISVAMIKRMCVVILTVIDTELLTFQKQVPFLFLTPIKRPSRPTSRNSFNSYRSSRPGTPLFTPSSPLAQGFRRPSTPLASGGPIINNYPSSSPSSSPVPAHAQPNPNPIAAGATSPSSSPRFLNAKATEFRPSIVRSMSSSSIARGQSPTPASSELWAHNYIPSPTLSSASLGAGRGSSNLAIAAPLLPEQSYSPSSSNPDLLGSNGHGATGGIGARTSPISIRHGAGSNAGPPPRVAHAFDDEDEDDPFSPFVVKPISPVVQQALLSVGRIPSSDEAQWSDNSSPSNSNSYDVPPPHTTGSHPMLDEYYPGVAYGSNTDPNLRRHMRPGYFGLSDSNPSLHGAAVGAATPLNANDAASDVAFAEQDMTPFEVLSSVFGSSVAPTLLQEALDNSGYDFDGAMAWLVDQALPPPPPGLLQHNTTMMQRGGVMVVGRDSQYAQARLGNNPNGRNNGRYGHQQQKNNTGNRVCRYFLQGECRRADCRFRQVSRAPYIHRMHMIRGKPTCCLYNVLSASPYHLLAPFFLAMTSIGRCVGSGFVDNVPRAKTVSFYTIFLNTSTCRA